MSHPPFLPNEMFIACEIDRRSNPHVLFISSCVTRLYTYGLQGIHFLKKTVKNANLLSAGVIIASRPAIRPGGLYMGQAGISEL
jgi:hypothetical protein